MCGLHSQSAEMRTAGQIAMPAAAHNPAVIEGQHRVVSCTSTRAAFQGCIAAGGLSQLSTLIARTARMSAESVAHLSIQLCCRVGSDGEARSGRRYHHGLPQVGTCGCVGPYDLQARLEDQNQYKVSATM